MTAQNSSGTLHFCSRLMRTSETYPFQDTMTMETMVVTRTTKSRKSSQKVPWSRWTTFHRSTLKRRALSLVPWSWWTLQGWLSPPTPSTAKAMWTEDELLTLKKASLMPWACNWHRPCLAETPYKNPASTTSLLLISRSAVRPWSNQLLLGRPAGEKKLRTGSERASTGRNPEKYILRTVLPGLIQIALDGAKAVHSPSFQTSPRDGKERVTSAGSV